jgi:DNA (cytosine-5)-methyltransferase 1
LDKIALDLFSGHGWGVAMEKMGVKEYPVDIMPEVRQTRSLNQMNDIFYENVWDVENAENLDFNTLIASPPCQSFSLAGSGSGRQALNNVIGLIHDKSYEDISSLRQAGEVLGDDRTALVLAPMHYIWKYRPEYIALEQVPTVQALWTVYAGILESWGYHVWTGVLQSEQFGVAQTRKRSILLARKSSPISAPVPTNSSYNSQNPYLLDSGMDSWLSIKDVLGDVTIASTGKTAQYFKLGKQKNQAIRKVDTPSMTLAFGNDYMSPRWASNQQDAIDWSFRPSQELADRLERLTIAQAALLQSYPAGFVFGGSKLLQYKQIANSVPPAMAREILNHLWEG